MKKKVLVTGATGFIGNHVIHTLLQQGHRIIASARSNETALQMDWFDSVSFIPFDLTQLDDAVNYYNFFERPEVMIHLSWPGLPNYKEAFHITQNLPLQKAFLKNMLANGLKDLTVTGTCFEYGMQEGCLNEKMECTPANPYAIAKNELRIALEEFTTQYGCSFKWARLFYMYGKGQSERSLIAQLDKALENGQATFNMSGGEQVRDFLPVEKVAENIVAIAMQQQVTGIINCCSALPISVKDFVMQYLAGKHQSINLNLGYYPYADYEPKRFWGDNSKLKSIIHD